MSEAVEKVAISIKDIDEFIKARLGPAVEGQQANLVMAAMFTLLIASFGPDDITDDEVDAGVGGMSQWMNLYLSSLRSAKDADGNDVKAVVH